MTPEEALLKAADKLGECGWTQGTLKDGDDAMCAVGAVRAALGGHHALTSPDECDSEALQMLGDHLGLVPKVGYGYMPRAVAIWNDAPERTAEDVILAMKKAAHHDA